MNTELAKRFLIAAADGYKWWPYTDNPEQLCEAIGKTLDLW